MNGVRWQALSTVIVDGKEFTRYETLEVFGGIISWIVKFLLQGGLKKGFEAQAEGLKKRCEVVS